MTNKIKFEKVAIDQSSPELVKVKELFRVIRPSRICHNYWLLTCLLISTVALLHYFNAIGYRSIAIRTSSQKIEQHNDYETAKPVDLRVPIVQSAIGQNDSVLSRWASSEQSSCGGLFKGYANSFASLTDVVLDPSKAVSNRRGGEDLQQVLNRPRSEEHVDIKAGFLNLPCKNQQEAPTYAIYNQVRQQSFGVMNTIVKSIQIETSSNRSIPVITVPTFLVFRFEFLNMYHTVHEWHALFNLLVFFKLDPRDVQLLFVDTYPKAYFDDSWQKLFNRVVRVSDFAGPVRFTRLILSITRMMAPLFDLWTASTPLLEEFRSFALVSHGIVEQQQHSVNLTDLSAVLILRKSNEYRRAEDGTPLVRMFADDDAVFDAVRNNLTYYSTGEKLLAKVTKARAVTLSTMTITEQLQLIHNTDLLVGMHGAGLILSIFLPPKALVIEMLPKYCHDKMYEFFYCIYKWRNLRFVQWHNRNSTFELANYRTRITPELLQSLFQQCVANSTSSA